MLQMALLFLVIALTSGALGLFGPGYVDASVAWFLFTLFLILFAVVLLFSRSGRSGPPPV